ncbi:hypothetical protein LCGC14_1789890 [marine sediment metagenome]|uniref:Uncharacterized protein n=1 Tax=marine sediment metagenome TaxID=412755 RepID=A0A0F9HFF7_9ZZZZ
MRIEMIISLVLLLIVMLDAAGDALRLRKHQVISHMAEAVQVALWIAVWALFEFQVYYIAMYILGRFIVFDLVFNLIAGNKIFYIGESSLYGRGLRWLAGKVRQPVGLFISMPKLMALVWWVAWFLTDGGK